MDGPSEPLTLTSEEVSELYHKLRAARHSINNSLSLIIAAAELVKLKPDAASRLIDQILSQPDRIVGELSQFGLEFETRMKLPQD
jgi:hypothetical protein